MQIHALDTCALTDLVEPGNTALRHRVVAHARAGRLIVPVTQGLEWEVPATRAKNDAKYRAMVDLLWTISGEGQILLNVPARCKQELRCGRALRGQEIFDAKRRFSPVVEPATVDARAADGVAMAQALLREEEAHLQIGIAFMDQAVRRRYGGDFPAGAETSIWRHALREAKRAQSRIIPFAESLARAALQKTAAREHIDAPDLDPHSLPTFWTHALIHVARIRDVAVLGELPSSRKAVDQLDVVHLQEAAAYADVFVTSDKRLRLFAARVHRLPCRVLSFEAWREEELA